MSESDDRKRHDQLTTAPKSKESDAEPRIHVVDRGPGELKRIELRDDAEVRPGGDPDLVD